MTVISFFVNLINIAPIALCICLLDCAFSIWTEKNTPFLRHGCFNLQEEMVYMAATTLTTTLSLSFSNAFCVQALLFNYNRFEYSLYVFLIVTLNDIYSLFCCLHFKNGLFETQLSYNMYVLKGACKTIPTLKKISTTQLVSYYENIWSGQNGATELRLLIVSKLSFTILNVFKICYKVRVLLL